MTLLTILILAAIIYYFLKPRPDQSKTHKPRSNDPQIRYLRADSPADFKKLATESGNYHLGDVCVGGIVNGRSIGAYAIINADVAKRRRALIRSGEIKRNNRDRYKAYVPGFDFVMGDKTPDGKALWHRTHYLPFRYGLSEGNNLDGLLFAGTAHLNHGDRPDMGYFVPRGKGGKFAGTSVPERVDRLYDMSQEDVVIHDIHAFNRRNTILEKTTHYSLDDFEQLADKFLNYNKNDTFRYTVLPEYKNATDTIPSSVTVSMFDLTKGKWAFFCNLPNMK